MTAVAVTGAGGFIGAYLSRSLLAQGHRVTAIDNFVRGRPSRLDTIEADLELIKLDVRNRDALVGALKGVDAVFHLAAINGTENFYKRPQLVLDVGVRGALAVCEACIDAGVQDLVVASSAEVYQTPSVVPTPEDIEMVVPNPLNPRFSYGGSKLISELIAFNYCRDRLAKVQVFRPHNVYGPDMGWKHVVPQLIQKVRDAGASGTRKVQLQGNGSETRAFCYVDDVVAGIITMWENGETMNVYHIGSEEEVTIRDLAGIVSERLGEEVVFEPGPLAEGGTPRRCPDISKMRRLGYEPAISLEEGIGFTARWYLENPRPDGADDLL